MISLRRQAQIAQQEQMSRDEARQLAERLAQNPGLVCRFCGGIHPQHECWRVKRVSYKGSDIVDVEFWYDWNKEDTIWPDSVVTIASQEEVTQ